MSEIILFPTIIIATITVLITIFTSNNHIVTLITELKIRDSFDEVKMDARLEDYRRMHENSKDLKILALENSNKDLRKNNKGLKKGHSSLQRKIKYLENENYCLKERLKYYERYLEEENDSKGVIYE